MTEPYEQGEMFPEPNNPKKRGEELAEEMRLMREDTERQGELDMLEFKPTEERRSRAWDDIGGYGPRTEPTDEDPDSADTDQEAPEETTSNLDETPDLPEPRSSSPQE